MLASTYDESEKQMINEQIAERLKKEEFFCEDIDSEVFLHPIHTYDSYGKIDKDVRNKINIELEKQLKELGKEYEIIDKNITPFAIPKTDDTPTKSTLFCLFKFKTIGIKITFKILYKTS